MFTNDPAASSPSLRIHPVYLHLRKTWSAVSSSLSQSSQVPLIAILRLISRSFVGRLPALYLQILRVTFAIFTAPYAFCAFVLGVLRSDGGYHVSGRAICALACPAFETISSQRRTVGDLGFLPEGSFSHRGVPLTTFDYGERTIFNVPAPHPIAPNPLPIPHSTCSANNYRLVYCFVISHPPILPWFFGLVILVHDTSF